MGTYRCRYLLVRARTKRSKFMFCPIPPFFFEDNLSELYRYGWAHFDAVAQRRRRWSTA